MFKNNTLKVLDIFYTVTVVFLTITAIFGVKTTYGDSLLPVITSLLLPFFHFNPMEQLAQLKIIKCTFYFKRILCLINGFTSWSEDYIKKHRLNGLARGKIHSIRSYFLACVSAHFSWYSVSITSQLSFNWIYLKQSLSRNITYSLKIW